MTTETAYQLIPIAQLHEATGNPRRTFNAAALQELTDSVRTHGVITPLLVRPNAKGFEIAAGHRRYRAAKAAGLAQVPAIVRPMTDTEFLEVLQIENLLREDLHPLEEARGYHALMDKAGYDVARIAERVGRSVTYVYDRMKLLALTKPAQTLFFEDRITAGHAILLARLTPDAQQRVIGKTPGEDGGLFKFENLLWDPDDDGRPEESLKPVSVRELQAWIDEHVKFDAAAADPMLFPETVGVITAAKEQAEKVVSIMYSYQVPPDARDGQRVLSARSWKRADGTGPAKRCEHAVTGVIVIGPGRGEAFKVCIAKDKCTTHWKREQAEAKTRAAGAAKAGTSGEERWEIERRKQQEEQARAEAERARWGKAVPAILEAVAAAVKKAPTKASGLLATIILEAVSDRRRGQQEPGRYVPRGTSAEDLVRHAAFTVLASEAQDRWRAHEMFPKRAKAFGLDVKKIVDEAAPRPKPEASEEKGAAKTPVIKKKAKRS